MPKIKLFLDSSALISGIISADGAARALLLLAETGHIELAISEQVVAETERTIARKAPRAIIDYRRAIRASKIRILRYPEVEEVRDNLHLIAHAADVPILLAAMQARVDFLVTLNRKHFIDDAGVALKTGLRIATPGDALGWFRRMIASGEK